MSSKLGQIGASIVSKSTAPYSASTNGSKNVVSSNYDRVMTDLLSSDVPSSSSASHVASSKRGLAVGTMYSEDEDEDGYQIEPATTELWKSVENYDNDDNNGMATTKKGKRIRPRDGNSADNVDNDSNIGSNKSDGRDGGYIDFTDLLSANHSFGRLTPSRNGTANGGCRSKYIDFSDIVNSSTDDYFDVLQNDSELVLSSIR